MKQFCKEHWILGCILLLGAYLRFHALSLYGVEFSLHSDDMGYKRSAIFLLKDGLLTYHNPKLPTIHIMPGQPFFLMSIFALFGDGDAGVYAAKVCMILFGIASIFMLYKIGKEIGGKTTGYIASFLLAVMLPMVAINNLMLSENIFIFCTFALLYYSLKLANSHSHFHFILVLFFFFVALYFRVQIAIYPAILFFYLVLKKYPWKKMMIQLGFAVGVLLLVLGPWWVRNYQQFHSFIPLTSGSGDPLLLGTYQGKGYPTDETYDEILAKIKAKHPHLQAHEELYYEGVEAKKRIHAWWKEDKTDFLVSYLYLKPRMFWAEIFYQLPVFDVSKDTVFFYYRIIKYVAVLSIFSLLAFRTKKQKEILFFIAFLSINTWFASIYVSLSRYNLPFLPLLFVFIGYFFTVMIQKIKEIKNKVAS